MISDFFPVPEEGVKYKTPQGEVYLVKEFLYNLGSIPDTVVYVNVKDQSVEFQDGYEEWNAKQFKPIGSSNPSQTPGDSTDTSKSDVTNDGDGNPNSTGTNKVEDEEDDKEDDFNSSKIPDGKYSSDPKINELAGLLEAGPSLFNQNFFPTDKELSDNNMVEKDVEEAFQKTIDEINKIREEGEDKRGGFLNEFLWTCAGVDKKLLRSCPKDWSKKAGMGGVILATAVLACLSGTFAIYTISEKLVPSIIIGVIWALVIFNLDRYLVNSMYSDGKASISWPEFWSGLPRIIIAIFIGVVISTPVELKIFEGKINAVINEEKQSYKTNNKTAELVNFETESNRLRKEYEKAEKELHAIRSCISAEEQGLLYDRTTGEIKFDQNGNPLKNPRGAGPGREYQSLKDLEKPAIQKVNDTKHAYESYLKKGVDITNASIDKAEKDHHEQIGLSKKLEILFELTSSGSMKVTRIFLALFFIILEILPVISKMMQTDGKYDKLVDLESDTMDKLTRIKEFNNINVLRSGHLSIYRVQILGHSIIDEENEGNNAFFKQDRKKINKDETEADNQEIYRKARTEAKEYIMAKIEKLFQGTYSHKNSQTVADGNSSNNKQDNHLDASDDAETI